MGSKNIKVLIYGVNGFIGKNLVIQLAKSKFDVYAVSSSKNIDISDKDYCYFKKVKFLKVNKLSLYNFDFAILNSSPNNKETSNKAFKTSIISYKKILSKLNKDITLVYLSSGIVCFKNNLNKSNMIYRSYKVYMENLIERFSFKNRNKYKIIRIFSTFGPYMPLNKYAIGCLILSLLNNRIIKLNTDGKFYRDFIYVNDLIKILIYEIKNSRSVKLNINSKRFFFKSLCKDTFNHFDSNKLIIFGNKPDKIKNYYANPKAFDKVIPNFKFKPIINSLSYSLNWFKSVKYIEFKINYEK
tara:strand:- start:1323 stop:2219 length:897 start_codon:yes stop_codon:yes gene_type:complete